MNGVQLLLVLLGALVVTAWARRSGRQSPLWVTAVGIAASFLPVGRFEIEADVILSVVVPPLLYSTALNFSLPGFRRHLRPIISLGAGLVLATWGLMLPISAALIPGLAGMSAWIAAAVIAPPDAVTAASIGRKLGLPRRLMTVLSGESLINDAMSLTLFSLGVTAATAGGQTGTGFWSIMGKFGYGAAVGVVVGLAIGAVVQQIRQRLADSTMETVFGLVVPFAAYLGAEELHASGVIAVVAAGLYLGDRSSRINFSTRITERSIFEILDVLLEALVFGYMGLQLRFVVDEVRAADDLSVIWWAVVVLVILMATRVGLLGFVGVYRRLRRALRRKWAAGHPRYRQRRPDDIPPWRETAVTGWTGMRGVVTVAAAAGVPQTLPGGAPFPGRLEIQVVAYVVAIGTLLIQGATLPWLIRKLKVTSSPQELRALEQERERAAQIGREAMLAAVNEAASNPPEGLDPQVLRMFRTQAERMAKAWRSMSAAEGEAEQEESAERRLPAGAKEAMTELRHRMLVGQRAALVAERDSGRLDDQVMREVLEQLDLEQAALEGHRE